MNSFRFITTCIALVLSVISLRAQELVQGSFRSLAEIRVVSVKWDLSKVDIEGQTINDFIEFKSYEEGQDYYDDFEKDIREILGDFIDEFNDTNGPISLTVSSSPKVILTIQVNRISRKGNEVTCRYIFSDKATGEILTMVAMTSKDGRVGSFTNLMGDAFEKAGKDLGKYTKKMLKAELKKRKK